MEDTSDKVISQMNFISNKLSNSVIKRTVEISKKISKTDFSKDSIFNLNSALKSFNKSLGQINSNDLSTSLLSLRAGYEKMLVAIGIYIDSKSELSFKIIDDSDKKEIVGKQNFLKQKRLRKTASENIDKLFTLFFNNKDNASSELDSIYETLSSFAHPSIYTLFIEKIEEYNNSDINIIIKRFLEKMVLFHFVMLYDIIYTRLNDKRGYNINSLVSDGIFILISVICDIYEFSRIDLNFFQKLSLELNINDDLNSRFVKKSKTEIIEVINDIKDEKALKFIAKYISNNNSNIKNIK